jgi:Phosphoserine phosphatase
MRLTKTGLIATLALLLFVGGCASQKQPQTLSFDNPVTKKLDAGNWDKFNKAQMDKLMAKHGKGSPNYNPAKPPYVVFDWDNTCIIFDIAEAAYIYQLEHLIFGMTPAQMDKAIRMGLSNQNFSKDFNNAAGQPVNIDTLAPDIVSSYTWLYKNYKGLKGKKSLEVVKKSPQYMDFITKMRYLYEAIGDTFDHAVSYPWITYLSTGLTEWDVRDITAKTVEWQNTQTPGKVSWTSPASLPGKAGVVTISWNNGLRLVPEMQDLVHKLRDNGITVWVCSASFVDIIKEISSVAKFGYNNPDTMVLAMELERDDKGRLMTEFRKGYDQTQGPGKTKTINRFLVSKYGYGPIMIAGDSEGDQNMMVDFDTVECVLIINRLRKPSTIIGGLSIKAVETYGKADAKYLLQGRDENKGTFVPSQLAYPLGKTEGQALRK